jgi:hypothetical protein
MDAHDHADRYHAVDKDTPPPALGSEIRIDVQGLQILRQATQPDIIEFSDRAAKVVIVDTTDLEFFEGKAFHLGDLP